MHFQIERRANGCALLIPEPLAERWGLLAAEQVEAQELARQLLRSPSQKTSGKRYQLEDLLSQITPENVHPETQSGPAIGAEIIEK